MWPPRRSVGLHRELEVDPAAGLEAAERGQSQGLVHRLGGEAGRAGLGRGQADAVDGDRVARGDLGAEAGRDAHRGAVDSGVDGFDGADVLDQPGEHPHHSLNRALISVSSPTASPGGRRSSGSGASGGTAPPAPPTPRHPREIRRPAGGDEGARLVDLLGSEECGGEGAAALEEERGDAAASEVRSERHRSRRRRGPRRPRRAAPVGVRRPRLTRPRKDRRHVEGAEELGVERQAGPAVEDDTQGLPGRRV